MNVQIQFLRQPDALRNVLREDGWRFTNNCMSHSQVDDEGAARFRLHRLRLLTSSLRIEFLPGKLSSSQPEPLR
jgi:hypothetical protein